MIKKESLIKIEKKNFIVTFINAHTESRYQLRSIFICALNKDEATGLSFILNIKEESNYKTFIGTTTNTVIEVY